MAVGAAVSIGGTVVATVLTIGSLLWVRKSRKLRKDTLRVERVRAEPLQRDPGGAATDKFPTTQAVLNILRFMELEHATCKEEPFNKCKLMSLPDYVRTLRIPGHFDWRRAVHTLLVHFRMYMLLPASDVVVKKKNGEGGEDPFGPVGGSPLVYRVLKNALSPLHLYALGEMGNLVAAEASHGAESQCMHMFLDGFQAVPDELRNLPNPFVFAEHMAQYVQGLDPDAPPDLVQGAQMLHWLPDLANTQVGMPKKLNAYQERCSVLLAMLLNHLAANALPDAWRPAGRSAGAQVQMTRGSPVLTTPQDLLAALLQEPGADMHMQIKSRVTGIGVAFAVREQDAWAQAPFVIPVRTGIVLMEGIAESSGASEVMSLMMHAEVCLRLRLPGGRFFRLAWFQGVEGFTGWHPAPEPEQPWNNSECMELPHTAWSSMREYREAMQFTTCLSSVINISADRLRLPKGGYGFLGVCNDSVAMVQAAMGEPVSQFPCILAGQAKTVIGAALKEYSEAARSRGDAVMAESAATVRKGLLRTPCDVVHTPSSMLGAIRRVEAGIPPRTPYVTLERARGDLKRAREQLLALDVGDAEALVLQQGPVSQSNVSPEVE